MVGVVIASILGLATTQLASNQLKAMRNVEQQEEILSLVDDIKRGLRDSDDCLANFNGKDPSIQTHLSRLVDADGDTTFESGKTYGSNRVRILGIRFGGKSEFFGNMASPSASASGRTSLSLLLEKTGQSFGSREKTVDISILIQRDAGGITYCSSSTATNNTLWQTSPFEPNKIIYNRNVGIGLGFNPDYRLDVRNGNNFLRFPADDSASGHKRSLFVSSSIDSNALNRDRRVTGYFGLKDNSNIVAKTEMGVSNGGEDNFESGIRAAVINKDGGANRAASFSLFKDSVPDDEESDTNLRIRSNAGYWEDSSNYSGLHALVYGSSGTSGGYKAKGQLAAKVGGTFYGGYFDSKDGVFTQTCTNCSVVSEMMPVFGQPENGSVLCLEQRSGKISPCTEDKSPDIIGIAQKNAEMILRMGCEKTTQANGENSLHLGVLNTDGFRDKPECKKWYPVALSGVSEFTNVICHLSDGSPLGYGDLLVSSSRKGFLRALEDGEPVHGVQIVGRAMSLCSKTSNGQTKERDQIHVWIR